MFEGPRRRTGCVARRHPFLGGRHSHTAGNKCGRLRFWPEPGVYPVISYYCIVSLPGVQVRDIVVVGAANDAAAKLELKRLAVQWPGFETIALYQGERVIHVMANPFLGFADEPITIPARAA